MEENKMGDKTRKFWIKVMAIVLAALMAGGTLFGAIMMILG